MSQQLFYSIVFYIFLLSCQSKQTAPANNRSLGWLPKEEYTPRENKAQILNDSGVYFQLSALQDPTLPPSEKQKRLLHAKMLFEQALEIDPSYFLVLSNLAAVSLALKDTAKAMDLMKQRLTNEPDLVEGWQALGFYSDLKKDSLAAFTYYKKAIEIINKRLEKGKYYENEADIVYYYDNWSTKALLLIMLNEEEKGKDLLHALIMELQNQKNIPISVYEALQSKNRYEILEDMKNN